MGAHADSRLKPAALHVHSYFSEGGGVSSPARLARQAAELGYGALALTDWLSLAGVVELHQACHSLGLQALTGATVPLRVHSQIYPVVLLAASRRGYGHLGELITRARQRDTPCVELEELLAHAEDLHLLSGGRAGPVSRLLAARKSEVLHRLLSALRSGFPDRLWVQLFHEFYPEDDRRVRALWAFARECSLPVVAAPEVRYATQHLYPLHEALTAARLGISVHTPHPQAVRNDAQYLPSLAELRDRFPFPEALANTARLAQACAFELLPERLETAAPLLPPGLSAPAYLRQRCYAGLEQRYPASAREAARARLEYELGVVEEMEMAGFFLLEAEIVDYCRSRGILAAGRGSAAGSLVCYTLGISQVDPLQHNLLFERFLHAGRRSTPDVDIDLASHRRDEVLAWVEQRFAGGERREAMTANYITYRLPSALQDLGRALDLPMHQRTLLSKLLGRDHRHRRPHQARRAQAIFDEVLGNSPLKEVLLWLLEQIEPGHVRHLAPHSGGVVLSAHPLTYYSPLQRSSGGILHLQLDKEGVEQMGLIKCDLLGLRMLGVLERAREEVYRTEGVWLDLGRLPDEVAVWDALEAGDTLMLFQLESPAQMQTSLRVKPRSRAELAHQIALIRPGPIQSGTVHPYLRRAQGLEAETVVHPALAPILGPTRGVLLYQDQQLRILHDCAGYSWPEAERLRKKIARAEGEEELEEEATRFVQAVERTLGATHEQAQAIWQMVADFRGYGFCASHAHAFAQHAYASAWLRLHFPAEYWAAFMTERPGFWPADTLRQMAHKLGVVVLPLDINQSGRHYRCEKTPQGKGVRLPLTAVHGLSETLAEAILLERLERPFASLEDFYTRVALARDVFMNLIRAGAFEALLDRRSALYQAQVLLQTHPGGARPLLEAPLPPTPALPPLELPERMAWDYQTKGFSELALHPLDLMRSRLLELGCKPLVSLQRLEGTQVRTAGLFKFLQKPESAQGFAFVVVEDGTQLAQLIVTPQLWERCGRTVQTAQVLVVEGVVERAGTLLALKVERLWGLPLETTPTPIQQAAPLPTLEVGS